MYRETTHLNFKLNLAQQLIISYLPQTSVRFFVSRKSCHISENCHTFHSAGGPGLDPGVAIRTRIPDFVKRVQKIGKDSIERQGVQLSCIVKRRI